jgi:hypothetical protein
MVRLVRFAGGVLCVLLGSANGLPAATDCDRSCLKTTLDQYLNAVTKHDPSAAPLSAGFRQTENAIVVRPPAGVWKTVTALGKVQRRYLDPVSGQAGYFGIVEEGSDSSVVTVRLRVETRKVTEAEWIVARKDAFGPNGPGGALVNPESLVANPPPDRTVPRIRTIFAAMYYPPPEAPVPNWPPYDGNWPLPATFAAPTAPTPNQ